MSHDISVKDYATLIFDCDGVILNSNKVKTKAFYQVTSPYGENAAQAMLSYHVSNGGVSRYKKFAYFLEEIAPRYVKNSMLDFNSLLQAYASHVRDGLLNCEIAHGLEGLRNQMPNAQWLIVSGGDQAELRDIFSQRGIAKWFNGGIFGSPRNKDEILANEIDRGGIKYPALFFGDSKYDYHAADSAGLDFIFISAWSEVKDWKEWVDANYIKTQPFICQ